MARLVTLVSLELRRRLRNPLALAAWLAIPLLLAVLMTAAFGPGGGRNPRPRVLIVDHDDSFVSGLLVGALTSQQLGEVMAAERCDAAAAAAIMDRGEASALLEIPEGFAADYLANRPVQLVLRRNPQQTVLPGIAEGVVDFLADAGGQLRTLLVALRGPDAAAGTTPSADQVAELSRRIYAIAQDPASRSLLDPNAGLTVTVRHPEVRRATRSEVVGWFAPGLLVMALLFLAQGQTAEVQLDVASGLLARAFTLPSPPLVTVGAEALAAAAAVALEGVLLVAAFTLLLGWRPPTPLLLLATLALTAVALAGLALLVRSLTRSPTAGNVASSGLLVGMGFLSGCFVPLPVLPRALAGLASWLPPGWAVQVLYHVEGGVLDLDAVGVAWRLAALGAVAAASLAVAAHRLARAGVTA